METFKQIVAKIKIILGVNRDYEVAKELNLSLTNLRQRKVRNSIPYKNIMDFLAKKGISINYFFYGQTPESLINSTEEYILLKYKKTNITAGGGGVQDFIEIKQIPFSKELLSEINIKYITLELAKNIGDSMEPLFSSNSILFIDTQDRTIKNNKVYIIQANNELFVKKVKIHNNKVLLISENKFYSDMEYLTNEIKVIGKVKAVFKKCDF